MRRLTQDQNWVGSNPTAGITLALEQKYSLRKIAYILLLLSIIIIIYFGEEKIANILTSYKIPFQREYIDLNYYYINSNRHPKFDFFVNNNYYIEYDGIQHFMPQHFFEPLEKQQQRDREKTNYCLKSEIPLIRIPYTHFDNISLQDLLISTSKFIVEEQEDNNENSVYQ